MVGNDRYDPMTFDWLPDEDTFSQLAQMIGLIDKTYDETDVGEFVAYWFGRSHVIKTPYQWNLGFVQNMKRKRTAFGYSSKKNVVGTQLVNKQAGVEVDENAKKLREKYGASK